MSYRNNGTTSGPAEDSDTRTTHRRLEIDFLFLKINLFIYFWLRWVFVAVHGLTAVASLVAEHGL